MNTTVSLDELVSRTFVNSTRMMTTLVRSRRHGRSDGASLPEGETLKYIYILLALSILGCVGNVFSLMVTLKNIKKAMNLMLSGMFISDVLYLMFLVNAYFQFSGAKVTFQWATGISGGCASMIGIERVLAITKPFWFKRNWKVINTILALTAIILINLLIDNLPYLLSKDVNQRYRLHINIAKQTLQKYLPCMIVTVSNTLIAIKLFKFSRKMANLSCENKPAIRQTVTVFPLTLVYIICTIPICILLFVKSGIVSEDNVGNWTWVARYLTLFKASSNFFFYVLANRNQRKKFIHILCNMSNGCKKGRNTIHRIRKFNWTRTVYTTSE